MLLADATASGAKIWASFVSSYSFYRSLKFLDIMYAARNLSFSFIIRFAWKPLLTFFIYSAVLTCLYEFAGFTFIAIPFAPIGLVGTAVAFYVGFKNN